ncbi:glycosyltransferase involved in cell wall biosynthesis [Novosphingobium chloroacetimidivorans]|uniref:Glycosyltransferase involved in cell wall biosynthesis n=1 Tax=Novosphingobium chloroacetimidivorans TaxID=1428314 RepID=A0A7W7KEB3_9SPHN|nr:glycosyltransferase family A protein [Novosphingobium chloroacetimidivorans]MBB4860836.1 glycosyltransferase involved in cell wall biosynthesis [Novosphingobium chloroacetimidivorans]
MSLPSVSVIIPTYNDERLAACLAALEQQDYAGPYEVIVVDNGSDVLPTVTGRARLLQEAKPGSYNARNRALGEATGTILAFTDSDCVPHPGWLSAGVSAVTNEPDIGLAGGQVQITPMSGAKPSLAELYEVAIAFPQETYVREGKYAATANMFTTRSVMETVGPFNNKLRSGGDAEWGQRTAAAGYRLVYVDGAVVDHPARTHDEIMHKLRRTTGGERDRRPGWLQCVRFCARHLPPPRSRIRRVLALKGIDPARRAALVGYCVFIYWRHAAERLRLQITGAHSSR